MVFREFKGLQGLKLKGLKGSKEFLRGVKGV